MHKNWWAVAALSMALIGPGAMAQTKKPAGTKTTKTQTKTMSKPTSTVDRTSYAIGADLAKNLTQQSIPFNPDMLLAGIRDVLAGKELALNETEMQQCFTQLQEEVKEKSESKNKVVADKNLKEGQEFLAANAKKEGVKTTPSGLQYMVLKEGTGPRPKDTSKVTTHYHGTLIDGTVFDSSVDRGQPAKFPVNGVIKGWQEALQLMPVGSKYRLFVPADLAYGDRGAGPKIGPNTTLIFDVELLSIDN